MIKSASTVFPLFLQCHYFLAVLNSGDTANSELVQKCFYLPVSDVSDRSIDHKMKQKAAKFPNTDEYTCT